MLLGRHLLLRRHLLSCLSGRHGAAILLEESPILLQAVENSLRIRLLARRALVVSLLAAVNDSILAQTSGGNQ